MSWIDVKDEHGAVLESHHQDGRHLIHPRTGQWECLDVDSGQLVFAHPQLSVIKRIAGERIELSAATAAGEG